ncbi:MAG: ATP cone domain-containing protein [Minisyncoccia bacterium]
MVQKVIKKSGQKEDYDENKIKNALKKACEQANISEDRIEEIINIVLDHIKNIFKDREEVNSYEIREAILGKLDEIEPNVSDSWRNYEESKK